MKQRKRKWLCRTCGGGMTVIKTKAIGNRVLKRRRECSTCGVRSTTYERERVQA